LGLSILTLFAADNGAIAKVVARENHLGGVGDSRGRALRQRTIPYNLHPFKARQNSGHR
jgi:hypothetical protein